MLQEDLVLFRGWEVGGTRATRQKCGYCPTTPTPVSRRAWFQGARVRAPMQSPCCWTRQGTHGMHMESRQRHRQQQGETIGATKAFPNMVTVLICPHSIAPEGPAYTDEQTMVISTTGLTARWAGRSSQALTWAPENALAATSLLRASGSSSVKWGTWYHLTWLL